MIVGIYLEFKHLGHKVKTSHYLKALLHALIFFSIACPLYSEEKEGDLYDLSFEKLMNLKVSVSTVSKREEKLSESPGIVSVITSEEIKGYGARNLWELMHKAPSIQPISSHLFRQNKMSIRGDLKDQADNHILVLLNGRPVREGFNTGQNFPFYMAFPVDIIKRVEIIRGPGSVLYGTNAFAGVLNVITKSAKEVESTSISYGVGTNSTNIQKLQTALVEDDFQMVLSGFRLESTGWDFSTSTAHPTAPTISGSTDYAEESFGVFSNISWKGLQLNAYYSETNYDMLGVIPYWNVADDNIARRGFADLGYTFELNNFWDLHTNATFNYYDLRIDESAHLATDTVLEAYFQGEPTEQFTLIFGGLVDNKRRNEDLDDSPLPGTYSLYDYAVYGQVDYKPTENLKFTVGAQYVIPDQTDEDLIPRFGIVYNFDENWGIKLLHSDAFRSAGPVEQFIDSPVLQGNPDLEPEKIQTTDFQLFFEKEELSAYLTAFYSEYSDLVTREAVPGMPGQSMYQNSNDDIKVKGLEFEYKYQLSTQWFTSGSTMYQETRNDDMLAPNYMFKMGVIYKPTQRLSFGLFDSYYAKPQDNDGEEVNSQGEDLHYLTFNMTYQLPTERNIELNLYLQNLLDETYDYVEFSRGWSNTIPMMDGINAYFTVTVRF